MRLIRSRYHMHVNCDQHLQTCLLASYFLRTIFFYSLPHSEHDIDYATLIMTNATQIWPGIQLTSDEFRLNPCALMDTLAYTCEALIRHDICLHVRIEQGSIAVHCRCCALGASCAHPVRCICIPLPRSTANGSISTFAITCSDSTRSFSRSTRHHSVTSHG